MKSIPVLTILLFVATVGVEAEDSKNTDAGFTGAAKSPNHQAYFPEDAGISDTYYRAALLPSLFHKREDKGHLRFRLAMFPSFSKPLFLTYSRGAEGASIEITRLQLRWVNDVLEPAGVELNGNVEVGNRIAELLEEKVVTSRIRTPLSYLTKEQKQMVQGLDGTTLIIEVSTEKDYTVNEIWTPEAIISEAKLLEVLRQQQVDVESMVDDLKKFIAFREYLLDIVGIKEPRYSISNLLDNG